jgi:membrane protein implicated in regulation of membrane protease activity
MASPGQPRGARGTVGHPNSALNLRLALALFGLVFLGVLAVLLFAAGYAALGWIATALAAVAAVDAVIVQRRRMVRRHEDPQRHDSLFE